MTAAHRAHRPASRARSRRLIAAVLVPGLIAVSCTSEETSTAGPALTTAVPTTVAPTTAPTTTAAPTTAAPTTIAPTTAAPTTVAPGPVDAVVPLLVGRDDQAGWLFVGAWQRDRWQEATGPTGSPIRPGLQAGIEVTVTDLTGTTTATLGANTEACSDGRVGPAIGVDVAAPEPPGSGYVALALPEPSWPLDPRPAAVIDGDVPAVYRGLAETTLVDAPVDPTLGSIEQFVVVDLDGDGGDEALLVFENVVPGPSPGTPGEFSTLVAIDLESRSTATVLRSVVAGTPDDLGFPVLDRFRVLDVADLNGDGAMEVIVRSWYDEGASVAVFTYDGTGYTAVLTNGCGA